jgi:hypothetical protein
MDKPVVAIVSDDQILNGGNSANLMARSVYDIDGDNIDRVWAEILPPNASPDPALTQTSIDSVELTDPNEDGVYEGIYNGFAVSSGTYVITYFAADAKGIYSLPKTSLVTQNSGTAPPPDDYEDDTNEDDDTYPDATVIVPNNPTPQLHTFHETGDEDWVKFYAVAGKTYKIKTSNLTPLTNTGISLYDIDGTTTPPIAQHSDPANYLYIDNDAGEGDTLVWTCRHDGIYYIRLTNNTPHYGANVRYELQVYEPTADFFTQGLIEGEVRSQSDNEIITSGKIQTTGSTALVQSNGTYIMFLGPADYTLSTDIAGYINESQEISVTAGAVLTGIDFILSPPDGDNDGYTIGEGDCDDSNPNIHPGASDANCDGIDQNCINGPDDGGAFFRQ